MTSMSAPSVCVIGVVDRARLAGVVNWLGGRLASVSLLVELSDCVAMSSSGSCLSTVNHDSSQEACYMILHVFVWRIVWMYLGNGVGPDSAWSADLLVLVDT